MPCKTGENKKNPQMYANISGSVFGGDEGDRTPDLCIANAALSQLSYTPKQIQFFSHRHQACEDRIMHEAGGECKDADVLFLQSAVRTKPQLQADRRKAGLHGH